MKKLIVMKKGEDLKCTCCNWNTSVLYCIAESKEQAKNIPGRICGDCAAVEISCNNMLFMSPIKPPHGEKELSAWQFVEKFYPGYSNCDEIGHNDDLCKLMHEEQEDGDAADNLLKDTYGGKLDRDTHAKIELDYNESTMNIYERAIEGFMEEVKA
jgi:hypothetical protein